MKPQGESSPDSNHPKHSRDPGVWNGANPFSELWVPGTRRGGNTESIKLRMILESTGSARMLREILLVPLPLPPAPLVLVAENNKRRGLAHEFDAEASKLIGSIALRSNWERDHLNEQLREKPLTFVAAGILVRHLSIGLITLWYLSIFPCCFWQIDILFVPPLGSFENWISKYYPVGPLSSLYCQSSWRAMRALAVLFLLLIVGHLTDSKSSYSLPFHFRQNSGIISPEIRSLVPIRQERPCGAILLSSPIDRLSLIRFADVCLLCVYFARHVPRDKQCDRRIQITAMTRSLARAGPTMLRRMRRNPFEKRIIIRETTSADEFAVITRLVPARITNYLATDLDRALGNFHSFRSFRARGRWKTTCPCLVVHFLHNELAINAFSQARSVWSFCLAGWWMERARRGRAIL